MIPRIMLTGRNLRIAEGMAEHLRTDRDYSVTRCAADRKALITALERQKPHILIACLSDETKESVRIYEAVKKQRA